MPHLPHWWPVPVTEQELELAFIQSGNRAHTTLEHILEAEFDGSMYHLNCGRDYELMRLKYEELANCVLSMIEITAPCAPQVSVFLREKYDIDIQDQLRKDQTGKDQTD